MKTRDLEELLSAHADGLNQDQDLAEALLRRRPEHAGRAAPLLSLARQVQGALRPVEPRPAFVAALKAQLAAGEPPTASPAGRPQSTWVWVLAGLGGLISIASAVLIVARLASGGARMTPAKMRTAH